MENSREKCEKNFKGNPIGLSFLYAQKEAENVYFLLGMLVLIALAVYYGMVLYGTNFRAACKGILEDILGYYVKQYKDKFLERWHRV